MTPETPAVRLEQRARDVLSRLVQYRSPRPKGNNPLYDQDVDYLARTLRQEVAAERQRIFKAICIDCDKPVEEFRGHLVHWFDKELLQYAICQVGAIRKGGTE